MLKITIVDTPTERRIVLSGKLMGPWIEELQRVWQQSRSEPGARQLFVDLNDVIHIEESANSLLVEMISGGTELAAKGLLNSWLIQALKKGKRNVSIRVVPQKSRIVYRVDFACGLMTTIAEGTVSSAQVREHLLREHRDSALPYRELIDARCATIDLSAMEIREIVNLLRLLSIEHRLGPTAVVVSTSVAYGVVRMLETLVEDICVIRPFRDLGQAENWLRNGQG